jgi:hypothetical protein
MEQKSVDEGNKNWIQKWVACRERMYTRGLEGGGTIQFILYS